MPVAVGPLPFTGFDTLGAAWQALEAKVPHSFFQRWAWVGCLAAERFPDPVVLQATRAGEVVGLALFNRRGGRLHLAEAGDAALDRPFTEHNGPLAADAEVAAALLRAAWRGTRRLVLGGVPPGLAAAAGGVALRAQARQAPWLDLDALRARGGDLYAALSANARYQVRRSNRHYAARGTLRIAAAPTPHDIDAWFEDIVSLHEASWTRRGQQGAFSTPYLRRFHRELMGRALADGTLDLWRVSAGETLVGFLYNLRASGVVLAYQSALVDAGGAAQARPGLTCHALAIEAALARGDRAYDFLAGDQRYKQSFADRTAPLLWVELVPRWSPLGLAARLRSRLRGAA